MHLHLHIRFLTLTLSLLLAAHVVNAEPASEIRYTYTYLEERQYQQFFPDLAPEGLHYHARMRAAANIDDTPEEEIIVLSGVTTTPSSVFGPPANKWLQMYLLITDDNPVEPKQKALFKLFDSGVHRLPISATPIDLHSPAFLFKQSTDVTFRLVELTGDGLLDIVVETPYGVALIAFENGAFKEVFSNYTITAEQFAAPPTIEYHSYYDAQFEPEGQRFHRFLGSPPPVIHDDHDKRPGSYHTRLIATANIDDTPEKETIALIVANTAEHLRWTHAYLLITENNADVLRKKDLFKLFDLGTEPLDSPVKTVAVKAIPFVFWEFSGSREAWSFPWVFFKLVDLTGDGILDIWVEQAEGIAVISFQEGEFREVCSGYSSTRTEAPIAYLDLDNDGTYEIKIPDRVPLFEGPTAARPEWVNLYEWNGSTYILNNHKYYTQNDEVLIQLLEQYDAMHHYAIADAYGFYIGLALYYRGNLVMARTYLNWVVKNGEDKNYIQAAEDILKKM